MIIAVTESNNVYALNATSGTVIWQRDLGTAAPAGSLYQGNIYPAEFGVTGGVASDGTNMFIVTGNTFNTGVTGWSGEAIIRLQAEPVFNGPPVACELLGASKLAIAR